MKRYVQFLFVVTCIVGVSCTPSTTDNVDTSPSVNSNTKHLQGDLPTTEQEQTDDMTIREKQNILLLKQDYQGALDLMPQYEKELFEEALHDKEFLENGKLKEETRYAVLLKIRSTYCYLYLVLGRDEEALQKIREIELPMTTNPVLLFMDCSEKSILLERLNRVDEAINEINIFFNNPNVSMLSITPLAHAMMMSNLIHAQLVKGDIESAQKNINQMRRDNLQKWPIHIIVIQQEHARYSEELSFLEYYISNLSETHTMRLAKREWKPPIPSPNNPKKVELDVPGIGFECTSKTDGTPFTLEDFRKIQTEQLRQQDPFLQPQPAP